MCEKESVYADLFDECFYSLSPFLSCSFFLCHFFSSAFVSFCQWFPRRLLTHVQSKTSIFLDLLQLHGIITMESKQIETYSIAWLKLVKMILFGAVLSKTGLIGLNGQTDESCFIKRMIYFHSYKAPLQSPLDMKAFEWLKCCWNDWFMNICATLVLSPPLDTQWWNMIISMLTSCLIFTSLA